MNLKYNIIGIILIILVVINIFFPYTCKAAFIDKTSTEQYNYLTNYFSESIYENYNNINDESSKNFILNYQAFINDIVKVTGNLKQIESGNNIDSNTMQSINTVLNYGQAIFIDYFGDVGNELYNVLSLTQGFGEIPNFDGNDYKNYFKNVNESYIQFNNLIAETYYNIDEPEKDENGMIITDNEEMLTDEEIENINGQITTEINENQPDKNQPDIGIDILDGALGIVTYPAKLVVLLLGLLAQSIMSLIASTGTPNGGIWLTIDNILFNQLALTDINIFSDSIFLIGAGGTYQQEVLTSTNPLLNIRISIAQWYYAFRNLAIVVSLLMSIYIGIRMAISSIAEQKAKYKAMLTNWFVGFGLIFILHFIIIIVININNAIIEILAKTNLTDNQGAYSNIMNQLFAQSWSPSFTLGWASAIMWVILVIMTFILLIMFTKRFVTVSFLTLIAPLITVTYAMDKAGDNRSQILNTWLKEFCYNVFIQIVYALSYLIFAKIGIDIMVAKLDLGVITLAVLSLVAMFLAVKIIKQIFGFDKASSLVQQIAMATVVTKAFSTAKKGLGYGKELKEKHKKENPVTKNLPMYIPSGKDTETFVKELEGKKRKDLMHAQIAQKSKKNKEKSKRPLKNMIKAFKVPIRAIDRFEKGTLKKGLGIDKLEEAFKTNNLDKITITAQDIANGILGDYVMKTNAKMTSNEFDRRIKRVEQKKSYELTGTDALLKSWMEALKAKEGAGQVQRLVANFKDNHF